MQKRFVKTMALSAAVAAGVFFALPAHAAQVLTPKLGGVAIDTGALPAGTTVAAGSTLFIDVEYSVTGSQTANEAGLGLKIGYDSNFFDVVVPATAVTALRTKCMIASPSEQLVSGTTREVVFGWLDTSIRTTPTAGSVGWPGSADPAAPGATNGCLNPGSIVTESGAITLPATLFRIGLKAKSTFTSGTTNVTVNTAGNISYVNTGNVDTAKTILVKGAAAPTCNLDVDQNGTVAGVSDGLLIYKSLLNFPAGIVPTGSLGAGATVTDGTLIKSAISAMGLALDVDGNGVVSGTSDGLLIYKALLGFPSASIPTGALGSGATRTTGTAIKTYINDTCLIPNGRPPLPLP